MTEEELQTVVDAVLDALKTNGKTIMQLTPVTTMASGDNIELNGGRRVEYSVLYDQLWGAAETIIEDYKTDMWTAINSKADASDTYTISQVDDLLASKVSTAMFNILYQQVQTNATLLDTTVTNLSTLTTRVNTLEGEVGALAEVYCTEAEYNEMVDAGTINANTKYFIYE